MKTRVQKSYHTVGGNRRLEWLRIRSAGARTLVFIPPLIGGGLSQPVAEFRFLVRRGCDLFSFSFCGHENSSGKFSPGKSIEDTEAMLSLAATIADREGLRLDGIGLCYSAIPLLHAVRSRRAPMRRIVLISAVPALSAAMILGSFLEYVRNPPNLPQPRAGLSNLPEGFGEFMLPGVPKTRQRFGVLARSRAQLSKTLWDLILDDRFRALHPVDLPVLCLYGSEDRILRMFDRGPEHTYEKKIRQICRRVRFQRLSGDHRLQPRKTKNEAQRWIRTFLAEEPMDGSGSFSLPPGSNFPSPGAESSEKCCPGSIL